MSDYRDYVRVVQVDCSTNTPVVTSESVQPSGSPTMGGDPTQDAAMNYAGLYMPGISGFVVVGISPDNGTDINVQFFTQQGVLVQEANVSSGNIGQAQILGIYQNPTRVDEFSVIVRANPGDAADVIWQVVIRNLPGTPSVMVKNTLPSKVFDSIIGVSTATNPYQNSPGVIYNGLSIDEDQRTAVASVESQDYPSRLISPLTKMKTVPYQTQVASGQMGDSRQVMFALNSEASDYYSQDFPDAHPELRIVDYENYQQPGVYDLSLPVDSIIDMEGSTTIPDQPLLRVNYTSVGVASNPSTGSIACFANVSQNTAFSGNKRISTAGWLVQGDNETGRVPVPGASNNWAQQKTVLGTLREGFWSAQVNGTDLNKSTYTYVDQVLDSTHQVVGTPPVLNSADDSTSYRAVIMPSSDSGVDVIGVQPNAWTSPSANTAPVSLLVSMQVKVQINDAGNVLTGVLVGSALSGQEVPAALNFNKAYPQVTQKWGSTNSGQWTTFTSLIPLDEFTKESAWLINALKSGTLLVGLGIKGGTSNNAAVSVSQVQATVAITQQP